MERIWTIFYTARNDYLCIKRKLSFQKLIDRKVLNPFLAGVFRKDLETSNRSVDLKTHKDTA
jgi:hypothetical protein